MEGRDNDTFLESLMDTSLYSMGAYFSDQHPELVDEVSSRPDFAVLCYSGFLKERDKDEMRHGLRIPANTPPILLAHSSDDNEKVGGSNAENSAFMYLALKRAGIPAELHIYATGDHDFGVRKNDKLPSSWTGLCLNWLKSFKLLRVPEN